MIEYYKVEAYTGGSVFALAADGTGLIRKQDHKEREFWHGSWSDAQARMHRLSMDYPGLIFRVVRVRDHTRDALRENRIPAGLSLADAAILKAGV